MPSFSVLSPPPPPPPPPPPLDRAFLLGQLLQQFSDLLPRLLQLLL